MPEEDLALANLPRPPHNGNLQEEDEENVEESNEDKSEENDGSQQMAAPTLPRLVLGIVTSTVFFVSLSCTEPCLRLLGPSPEVPTLELLIIKFSAIKQNKKKRITNCNTTSPQVLNTTQAT
ncbi:hypothetical protein CAPTEDRAFT_202221 [Capitella teleta]|uniref:Uncharacterized protein n=1 Tax=Capitella teleta TaxID=283909 RepID=R7V0R4_CAPTE|nr:hypothetical protein CAPTEDRAFT_202221 [Capitella teleta]|eukprot:ELU12119.1 hypothetical protein CAPTEDRAFT_202221 [Capitella teleta]